MAKQPAVAGSAAHRASALRDIERRTIATELLIEALITALDRGYDQTNAIHYALGRIAGGGDKLSEFESLLARFPR